MRFRPRYADVAATLALVFALSGTAYAVAALPPNSVDTQSIQDQAVTAPKIKAGSVNTSRITNETVQSIDVLDGSLTGDDIADESLGTVDLGTDSVDATEIADNSIDGGEIVDGSIGNAELGSSSVTGDKVADNSIDLADMVGANAGGSISFNLGANSCGTLSFSVSGSLVGQSAIMTYTGTVAVPPAVVFSPLRVVSDGHITVRACNVSSSSVSVSGLGVRVVTFG